MTQLKKRSAIEIQAEKLVKKLKNQGIKDDEEEEILINQRIDNAIKNAEENLQQNLLENKTQAIEELKSKYEKEKNEYVYKLNE